MVADLPKLCLALTLSPKSPMTANIHVRPHCWVVYFKSSLKTMLNLTNLVKVGLIRISGVSMPELTP